MKRAINPGEAYGCLTFVARASTPAANGGQRWQVSCSCGKVKEVALSTLFSLPPPSCRCPPATGDRYGMLEIVNPDTGARAANTGRICAVRCDCGTVKTVALGDLRKGTTRSCGCSTAKLISEANRVHSETAKSWYNRWTSMHDRCYNPKAERYPQYGGRGIGVCPEWFELEAYSAHMQRLLEAWPAGEPFHVDREDVDGDYTPENTRLLSILDSARNRTNTVWVEYQGRCMPVTEAAELSGVEQSTLRWRIRQGWPEEKIFNKPLPGKGRPKGSRTC